VSETPARTRYELFVGRHVSPATLATFPVALVPTSVPRNTVHRLRVGADSDIAEIVRRLTERHVEILDIRRCPQRPRWRPRQRTQGTGPEEAPSATDVVVLLPLTTAADTGDTAAAEDGEAVVPISLDHRRGAARG
jgi:hypothetical protein